MKFVIHVPASKLSSYTQLNNVVHCSSIYTNREKERKNMVDSGISLRLNSFSKWLHACDFHY